MSDYKYLSPDEGRSLIRRKGNSSETEVVGNQSLEPRTGKTAIVMGAGGFIGSHLVKKLKDEGFWVRGIDLKCHLAGHWCQ